MCAPEGEGDTSSSRREVVGAGGDGVELAVVLILSHELGGQDTASHVLGKIEQLLRILWVRSAVGVHVWCEPAISGNRSITLPLQIAARTNTSLIAKKITNDTKRLGLVGVVADKLPSGEWVAIEEHGCGLEEDRSSLVQTKCLPQAIVD